MSNKTKPAKKKDNPPFLWGTMITLLSLIALFATGIISRDNYVFGLILFIIGWVLGNLEGE